MYRSIKLVLLVTLGCLAAPAARGAEGADFRTRVGVVPMANHTADAVNDPICRTVSDTVSLVLRLLGTYAVSESYDEPALAGVDTTSDAALAAFAESGKFDELIFGDAKKQEGVYLSFSLHVYSRSERRVKYEQIAVADTLFDVFDAADGIAAGLISQFSDKHIGFGKVEVRKGAGKGAYQVFLNDTRIRSPETGLRKVLNGAYDLIVKQDRLLGLTEIYRETINVIEDRTTSVAFDIPTATAEETAYLDGLRKKLESASAGGGKVDGLLREIADFQSVAARIDYDDSLIARSDQTLKAAGALAKTELDKMIADADGKYFARRPSFDQALDAYGQASRLLNDVYAIETVAGAPAFVNPVRVVPAADGSRYVLDLVPEPSLRRVTAGRTADTVALPYPATTAADLAFGDGIAVDRAGNVYVAHPSTAEILVYDPALSPRPGVTIPEWTSHPETSVALAISPDDVVFVLAGPDVAVFELGGARLPEVEKSIRAALDASGTTTVKQCLFDHQGRLLLFDAGRGTVVRLDYLGNLISTVSLPDVAADGSFAVDGLGCYYLSVPQQHQIRKYNPQGQYLTSVGRYGVNPGEFSLPRGISAAADGTLAVCDTANARLQILTLKSAPVLLADVVQYGDRFAAREQAAERAVKKMGIVQKGIRPGATFSQFAGTFLGVGAVAGLAFGSSLFAQVADARYQEYRAATTVPDVTSLRAATTGAWTISRGFVAGTYAAAALASVLFTTTILNAADQATARDRAVRNLQATGMDSSYVVDRTQYRSLRTAQTLGVITGVLPPLLGATAGGLILWAIPGLAPAVPYVIAGSVAIPPIWSHLYGGRFHTSLFLAGLIADGAAASALAIYLSRPVDWQPSPLGLQTGNAVIDSFGDLVWTTAQREAPILLSVAALAVRLTAGIYDASMGWLQAKDYDKYRAVKKAPVPVSLRIEPEVREGSVGVSIAARF